MATATGRNFDLEDLARRTYRADGITAAMTAMIVVVGVVMVSLLLVFLSNLSWGQTAVISVDIVASEEPEEGPAGARSDDIISGDNADESMIPPSEEQVAYEQAETSQTVTEILEAIPEDLFDPTRQERRMSTGTEGGLGDADHGSGEGKGGAIPRHQRWIVVYERDSIQSYSDQLDAFNIELVVTRPNGTSMYRGFSQGRPSSRQANEADGKRIFFVWKDAQRRLLDNMLLAKASVSTDNAIVAHFYTPQLESHLADLEKKFANRTPKQIRQTRFGIRQKGNSYEFYVVSQTPMSGA